MSTKSAPHAPSAAHPEPEGPLQVAHLAQLPLEHAITYLRRWRVRRALEATGGNARQAAEMLGLPSSTFFNQLRRPELAAELELTSRTNAPVRTSPGDEEIVADAWEKSGHSLRACARMLGRSPSTLRGQIIRYGLPDPPAPAHSDGRRTR